MVSSLVFRIPDKDEVQKPSNSETHDSSELVDILPHSFSIYSGIYGKITNK
jgi:hypothetical protein